MSRKPMFTKGFVSPFSSGVLHGIHIDQGAIIQSGAVVYGEIPPYAFAGGNAAQVFQFREVAHFLKLQAEWKALSDKLCNLGEE